MPTIRPLADRFWTKVDRRGPSECWLWQGTIGAFGYGVIGVDSSGRKGRAHRVSYELAHGPVGDSSMVVMHSCDVRACVNPAHLSLGTRSDNAADRHAKGRTAFGSQRSQLTEEDVRQIRVLRALGVTHAWLGEAFGMTYQNVFRIAARLSWKHVA